MWQQEFPHCSSRIKSITLTTKQQKPMKTNWLQKKKRIKSEANIVYISYLFHGCQHHI
jgi:hypothetical protein